MNLITKISTKHTARQIALLPRRYISNQPISDQEQQKAIVDTSSEKQGGLLVKLSHIEEVDQKKVKKQNIKNLEKKYGKIHKQRYDVLAILDRYLPEQAKKDRKQIKSMVQRAEQSIESLFFKFEKVEVEDSQSPSSSSQVTIRTDEDNSITEKLHFEEKVRLLFEKDSLALKSIQDGVVDFADKRISLKAAALDQQIGQSQNKKVGQDLFEVDLGELKSLKDNQIHIDEIQDVNFKLEKGQQIVDDQTIDSQKYKLVMIGRKLNTDHTDDHLIAQQDGPQHVLSRDVFHESGERFKESIKLDEGVLKHYFRHVYLIGGMILGVSLAVKIYQASFQIMPLYQDYLDWVIFQHVKRGRSVEQLTQAFYGSDKYSVEARSN